MVARAEAKRTCRQVCWPKSILYILLPAHLVIPRITRKRIVLKRIARKRIVLKNASGMIAAQPPDCG
eukprot:750935-Hanusia_phi.AAC.1